MSVRFKLDLLFGERGRVPILDGWIAPELHRTAPPSKMPPAELSFGYDLEKHGRAQCSMVAEGTMTLGDSQSFGVEFDAPMVCWSSKGGAFFLGLVDRLYRPGTLRRAGRAMINRTRTARIQSAGYVFRLPRHRDPLAAAAFEIQIVRDFGLRAIYRDWCLDHGWDARAESLAQDMRIKEMVDKLNGRDMVKETR